MKILLINSYYQPHVSGGSEISVMLLAEGLARLGHAVSVLTIQPVGPAEIKMINGVNVYYMPITRAFCPRFINGRDSKIEKLLWSCVDSYNLLNRSILKKVIDSTKPDVVHTNNLAGFSVYTWKAVKGHGIPIVHTLRDMYLVCLRSLMFRRGENCSRQCLSCRIYSLPKMIMARQVDYIIGVSRFILDRHIESGFFRKTDCEVVYNSTLLPLKSPGKNRSGGIRFGYIGRLHETKGIENLIRSYKQISTDRTELLIAGSGSPQYRDSLKRLAGTNEDIRFMGFMDSSSFYSEVDIVVVPSKWEEPFGRVIIEAFCHGIPVIAANRGGIPEIVSAENGWLFNPDSEEELVSVMAHCLDNFKKS